MHSFVRTWLERFLASASIETIHARITLGPMPGATIVMRPIFELGPADHPLSKEFHNGISPDQVKEITPRRVREAGQAG